MSEEIRYRRPAVDHEGQIYEVFVTKRGNRGAALKFIRKATKRYGCPEIIGIDYLRSTRAAMNEIDNDIRQAPYPQAHAPKQDNMGCRNFLFYIKRYGWKKPTN